MAGAATEGLLLRAEMSGELVAAFQTVAESEAEGESRFHPALIRTLAQVIVCRTYATALLELTHLVRIAAASDPRGRYEPLFWGLGVARAERYRHHLLTQVRSGWLPRERFSASAVAVELRYGDGSFAVSYSRMPFLTALMEFLITALGYGVLDRLLGELLQDRFTQGSASRHANSLARQLYDYLRERLPTVQQQRKFHRMMGFLEEQFGPSFPADVIRDEVVLAFWLRESLAPEGEGVDFKTFATVGRAFVRLRQSLEQALDLEALDNPLPIGPDREAGELDPADVARLVVEVEADDPLAALAEHPAVRIKFLNQREREGLELVCAWGRASRQLPLTVLRCQVYGALQLRLTQALRRKAGAGEMARLIDEGGRPDYAQQLAGWEELQSHLHRMLQATLAVLARLRHGAAISALLALRPGLDLSGLAPRQGTVVPFQPRGVMERFLLSLEQGGEGLGEEIATLLREAGKALKGFSRQGFGPEELRDEEVAEGFARGAELLPRLSRQLEEYLEAVARLGPREGIANDRYHEDRELFLHQFRLIYPVAEESES